MCFCHGRQPLEAVPSDTRCKTPGSGMFAQFLGLHTIFAALQHRKALRTRGILTSFRYRYHASHDVGGRRI